ncbi:Abscisic acid 8'-hydroxylase 1 [Acorus calamus]|uniref:Abscisic acid 8'-hydroxylase 1 n=1 Tax=Acorus calamus TaxID=4465 RepID=A0AAV9F6P7_ACOCL|nr:Abscisic acid 8'-hydroxylase 1 [Acorus calamus]
MNSLFSADHQMVVVMVVLVLLVGYYRWSEPNKKQKKLLLPPGSMGWPYIGETLKLYTQNPRSFYSKKLERYGDIFKTHLLGCPCVMVSSPEAVKFVLVTRANLFKPTYPPSKECMIGPWALNFHQGIYHSRLKKLIQATFLPSSIQAIVSVIERIILGLLPDWENKIINAHSEMKRFSFDVAMVAIFGSELKDIDMEKMRDFYYRIHEGYNSMPINLLGFRFHRAMKARQSLDELLKKIVTKRRENKDGGGLVGALLRSIDQLTDSQVTDNLFGVIFAAQDTTASILTWILKHLSDNGALLDLVMKEQEGIKRELIKEKRGLTWNDTRKMSLTTRVIQETLRAASIVSFTYREAVEDVEFQGYLIPRGWKVLPLFRSIHHSSDFFINPEKFDPSRFQLLKVLES